ncbi:hypothetical protein [Actimicrobium sp. CCI2.3]|uniref:hypothetical protein n=1 Tax=Actimicrobium sp. CCI2.3 TaxID=3048616 RepID=UPI002AB3508C|nr:hypothetical protein [Actimicrobium sp. CCI2.3]MDY7574729.1 hypothetical protein [Actimicrobium sp. CCI2.3]MEB0020310.1 hypothetical protein [Actimicrobium sp. CCI2.3]
MSEYNVGTKSHKKFILIGTLVVVALGGLGYAVYKMSTAKSGPKSKAPKITLLLPAQPPPPPPPPPKFEKKPEPPKEQKEIKMNQPVEKKSEPQQSPELKMDGPAGDGPSAFASGTITSEDLSKVGTGKTAVAEKTGMFNPFNNYGSLLKGELQRYLGKSLAKNDTLRRRQFAFEVHVWVDASGALKRYELVTGSKEADADEVVRSALLAMPNFSQAPPAGMPQPIRLRVTTRG